MKSNYIILVYPRIMRIIKSQPFHVNLVTSTAQYFLHKIHVGISRAKQLVLVERSGNRFSAIVLEQICYGISTLHFNDFKHLGCPIWCIAVFENGLVLAHVYRIAYFELCRPCDLYTIVHRQESFGDRGRRRVACRSFDACAFCNLTPDAVARRSTCNFRGV